MRREYDLNGIWDFEFSKTDIKPENLTFPNKITVPGCFDAMPEYAEKRGIGSYRRTVRCGGLVKLEFEAIGLRADILWDGKPIGKAVHPYSPEIFRFDAGPEGEHELVIMTDNRLEEGNSTLFYPFYDFYGYGGIYRNVRLTVLPPFYLDRAEVIPESIEDGTVLIRLFPGGEVPETFPVTIRFDGGEERKFEVKRDQASFRCRVPDFRVWSPETPYLHRVEISIPDDSLSVEFGIRKIECREGKLLLNGKALKLIGWNRHESHPEFGSATPDFLTCSDLQMIKSQGCNFIRGCHYKQKDSMLTMCDRMGLLVWEESLGWGNNADQLSDPEFIRLQCEQTEIMVKSSINHPSVILWGFLNESHSDSPNAETMFRGLFETIRKADPSRPVTYASNRYEKDLFLGMADVISFNIYPGWYDYDYDKESNGLERIVPKLEELAGIASSPEYIDKPLILSEIGAAAIIGDHSGLMWSEEYQADLLEISVRHILENPRYTGIAIWQFSNSRTYTKTSSVVGRPRGFNNKGGVDEYRHPKLAWKRVADICKEFASR